jgi:hypothetical protein
MPGNLGFWQRTLRVGVDEEPEDDPIETCELLGLPLVSLRVHGNSTFLCHGPGRVAPRAGAKSIGTRLWSSAALMRSPGIPGSAPMRVGTAAISAADSSSESP